MIINKLTIENVGLFRGEHTFDLKPDFSTTDSKPIILIGGKNGAGKTTFFESIRLCLYGPNFQEKSLSKSKYEKYLSDKIHRNIEADTQSSVSRVEVEFEYSHLGNVEKYLITRLWQRNGQKIIENLKIFRNGKLLDDLELDQWQEFLNGMIPPGISQLFFFDGEKIQQLAEDEENKSHLNESFKSLLGLDLVERLQGDLRIYVSRNSKEIGATDIGDRIKEIEDDIEKLEVLLDKNYQARAQKQSYSDKVNGDIERQELKIAGEGGTFANKRDDLKLQRIKLDSEIETINNQIRELCFNLLPFAITPNYCKLLKERLIEEEKYQKWKGTQDILNSKVKEIDDALNSSKLWDGLDVESFVQKNIADKFSQIINEKLKPSDDIEHLEPVHQLSPMDQQKIMTWIEMSFDKVPDQLNRYTNKLEKLIRKRQKVEKALSSAPDDDVLLPLIQKLNELNIELGSLQEQLREKDEEIRKIELELDDLRRKLEVQYEKLQTHGKLSERLVLADKVRSALKDYTLHLRKEKIKEFSDVFLSYFNVLLRKEKFIEKIEISEDDFSVSLYEYGGEIVQKHHLSAGEKQIYAISMLWALTQISGRPLPFVIDTPLGRLDNDHRDSLITNFFPNASHQMIIFSTDTEVDMKYFKMLLPHTARSYHLDYSAEDRMTKVTEGYFWKKEKGVVIDEL